MKNTYRAAAFKKWLVSRVTFFPITGQSKPENKQDMNFDAINLKENLFGNTHSVKSKHLAASMKDVHLASLVFIKQTDKAIYATVQAAVHSRLIIVQVFSSILNYWIWNVNNHLLLLTSPSVTYGLTLMLTAKSALISQTLKGSSLKQPKEVKSCFVSIPCCLHYLSSASFIQWGFQFYRWWIFY